MVGALFAAALVDAGRAQRPRLLLASGATPPLVGSAQNPGFLDALAQEVFGRIGIDAVIVPMSQERAALNADAGIEDGVVFRPAQPEPGFPNLVRVPEPLMNYQILAYTSRPDVQVRGWDDLGRHGVAYLSGWRTVEARLEGARNVTAARSPEQLLTLLQTGRAEIVLLGPWVTFVRRAREAGVELRRAGPPLAEVPMVMLLHRRHEALVQPVAQAITQVRQDGTWQRLYDRHLAPAEPPR